MKMRMQLASIGAAALGIGWLAGAASAATTDGAIITNAVSATYSTTFTPGPGSGYAVSYSATARVLAQDPCIQINKVADPANQVSGGVVTFRIWVVNCSASGSAFNIMVYDMIPLNTTKEAASFSASPPTDWLNAVSTTGIDGPYLFDDPVMVGDGNNWIRSRLSRLGPNKSAWVSYQVTIQ